MSRATYRKLLKARFTGDIAEMNKINEELGDISWKDSGLLVAAIFSLAVDERFADDSSSTAVRDFIAAARQEFPDENNPVKPLIAEGVVRAALGEDQLLDGIAPVEGMQVQAVLTTKIINDAEMSPSRIDELLDRAEALLDSSI